eukprot:2811056-Rhodomonas_salina.3
MKKRSFQCQRLRRCLRAWKAVSHLGRLLGYPLAAQPTRLIETLCVRACTARCNAAWSRMLRES